MVKFIGELWLSTESPMRTLLTRPHNLAVKVCEFVLPSLNGLWTAFENTTLSFGQKDFADLVAHSNAFLSNETSEHIRDAIDTIKQESANIYARRVLAQYARESIVLSSNRIILQVLTVKRNMVGRIIDAQLSQGPETTIGLNGHVQPQRNGKHVIEHSEDEGPSQNATPSSTASLVPVSVGSKTFDDIWTALLANPAKRNTTSGQIDLTKVMRTEYIKSLQFFADIREFANELLTKGSVSHEFYYAEIMGISLVLAAPIALTLFSKEPLLILVLTE